MAKKVSKKASGRGGKSTPPAATRTLAGGKLAAAASGFSEGLDTSDLPDNTLPEINIKDGDVAVIRFLKYDWEPTGKPVLSMRGLVHQIDIGGKRFRKFTCMGEGCPLCQKGDSPRHEFFTLVLLRAVKTSNEYTANLKGKVCLMRMGKRAVEMMDKEVMANLGSKSLDAVDVQWKRHGKTTDTVHLFQIAPKTPAFSAGEQKVIREAKDLSVWDKVKPLSAAVLQTKANMLSSGGAEVPEAIPDGGEPGAGFDLGN